MQIKLPYMQIRGGSSKGVYFDAQHLPSDRVERDKIILAAMEGVGNGDLRQIDGLGGAQSLTSKVAVVAKSKNKATDLDYLFLQVVIGKGIVTDAQNCGNILAGVLPFALETGMIEATENQTTARINMINMGGVCEVVAETPQKNIIYHGTAKVDGVPGTASPIICNYIDIEGSSCGALLPTKNAVDIIDNFEVTCIDNGMPSVILLATDFGLKGSESPTELNENQNLKQKLESIRLQAGVLMNLGDVQNKTIPKMCLISMPINGGAINTRTFIPHVCHEAIGVLGAVSVATACLIEGSVAHKIAPITDAKNISVEHPTGEFTVNIEAETIDNKLIIKKSGVIRTARAISKGEVFLPENLDF